MTTVVFAPTNTRVRPPAWLPGVELALVVIAVVAAAVAGVLVAELVLALELTAPGAPDLVRTAA